MAPVTINHNTIDLDPNQQPHGYFPADAASSNHILIQYSHTPTEEDHAALDKVEALVIHRIDDNTLLCRYHPADLNPIKTLPSVRHAAVYHPDFVPSPHLARTKETDGRIPAGIYVHFAAPETGSDVWHTIQTTIDPGARLIGHGQWSVKLWLRRDKLPDVAALDCVAAIEPARRPEPCSNQAVPAVLSGGETWPPWPGGTPFNGAGEVVAVADTGYGDGTVAGHPMFGAGRIVGLKYAGDPLAVAPAFLRDDWNHGTAVAGCVAASWDVGGLKNRQSSQARRLCARLEGTAPGADIFFIRCFDVDKEKPDTPLADLNNLWTIPYDAAGTVAKIYNISWATRADPRWVRFPGRGPVNVRDNIGYGPTESVIDASAIDDPELLVLVANGNKGADDFQDSFKELVLRQVVHETCAKNILAVGMTYNARWFASQKMRDSDGYRVLVAADALDGDGDFANEDDIAKNHGKKAEQGLFMPHFRKYCLNSSRGPTESGLLKPDVVAPGAGIFGADARATFPTANAPLCAAATPSDHAAFWVGTSFATPFVAGMAADLRQALRKGGVPLEQPPGMLIKALIVNGAQDLQGTDLEWMDLNGDLGTAAMPPSPNNAVGFGFANLRRSLVPLTNDGGGIWLDTVTLARTPRMQNIVFPRTNPDARNFLRVTLTWADVPGVSVNNYLRLSLLWNKPDTSNGIINQDPLQPLPYEPSGPDVPVMKQVVHRITLPGATSKVYSRLVVQVVSDFPIIPYVKKGVTVRTGQPFSVAYGFYSSIKGQDWRTTS